MDRDDFSFRGCGLLDHLDSDRGTDDHAFPQIPNPEHEAEPAVTDGDDSIPAENKRFCPPVRLRCFHEDASKHDGVDNQAHNILKDQDCDGEGTLFCHHSAPKTNGHLDLDGEEECRSEGPVRREGKIGTP